MWVARQLATVPMASGLVRRFGAERVWDAGLEVMGHPWWQPSASEVAKVAEYLMENQDS
jgi:hypothetical protein